MVFKKSSPVIQREHGLIAVIEPSQPLMALIDKLCEAGVPREGIAFMTKGTETENSERLQKDGQAESGGMMAGGLAGALAGLSTLAIPGFGVLLLAGGPLLAGALTLAGGLGGVGLGAIMGAILEEDVVKGRTEVYEQHLASGYAILMIESTIDEAVIAEGVLKTVPTLLIDIY